MLVRTAVLSLALLFGCKSASFEVATETEDSSATDGGGEDTLVADSGSDASVDTGKVVDDPCAGKPDGASCSTLAGFLCVKESCVPTSCGDQYVDKANSEDCDDGNDIIGDGCDNCRYTCASDGACDNGQNCDGTESCTAKHLCKSGMAASDGTPCALLGGEAGACNSGTCAKIGCGNKIVTSGEDCDDGNGDNGDGCDNDCTFSCKADVDCDDHDVCNGVEICDTSSHKCAMSAPALACDDGRTCTKDRCDPVAGCQFSKIDDDGDGHSCEDDCNDGDPSIYVGAPELCDSKDNDCNGKVDDGTVVMATCYLDADGDGYGIEKGSIKACTCPMGTTPTVPADTASSDCYDADKSVHPKEETFFGVSYCTDGPSSGGGGGGGGGCSHKSFDYDCNGSEEKQYKEVFSGDCAWFAGSGCNSKKGWKGSVPACGDNGIFIRCVESGVFCNQSTTSLKQACR